jgi:hypothetical protein
MDLMKIGGVQQADNDYDTADRLRTRQPPFTQDALDRWLDEVLAGVDVSAFMSD